MKKILLIVVAVLLLFFTSCEEPHQHTWTEIETKESTCVDGGYTIYGCSCGAQREVEYEALGHDFSADGKCTRCENLKADVEAAEARIGLVYYAKFVDAVSGALKMENKEDRIIEVLKESISFNAHEPKVNGSMTINANNADFGNCDLSIYTYDYNQEGNIIPAEQGTINVVVNDAKNLYLWGQPDALLEDDSVLNITINNLSNMGTNPYVVSGAGRIIYLTGKKGEVNILLENSSCEKAESPVYSNHAGTLVFRDTTFKNCSAPLNLNLKANGDREVLVENCYFDFCGTSAEDNPGLSAYSAPIRVVNNTSDAAKCTLTVKDSSFTNTIGTNGDVLIVDDNGTYKSVTANFENNKTNIQVKNDFNSEYVIVEKGAKVTLISK